jgi:hypothetical protein
MLLAGFVCLLFAACKDDRDSNPTLRTPATFVLNTPAYASGAVYDLDDSSAMELTCSQPDYGFTAATNYSVQVSLSDGFTAEGKYLDLPTTYSSAKIAVDALEVAVALTNLALDEGKTEADFPLTSKLYIRLKASLTNGEGEVYSNSIALEQVRTSFALSPVTLPSTLYAVIGDNGELDWENALSMVPAYDNNGTFWHILYCKASAELKFNAEKAWDGHEFGSSATLEDNAEAGLGGDGNVKVTHAGWYLVIVRATIEEREIKYTIQFEKPNVYLLGQTWGEVWDLTEEQLFTVPVDADGYFVSPAFKAAGEVRMCVNVEGKDAWWKSEFIVFSDGNISYRGTGGDQDRYTQSAGKHAYLNFMTGKGHYE